MNVSPMKQPGAFVPIAMSLAALLLVLGHAAMYGRVHEADEGTAAHIFQLLMAVQVPIVAFFALKGFSRAPGTTLRIVAVQVGAAFVAFAAVYFLT